MLEDFWEEFETFSNNVMSANHKLVSNELKRWFSLLDSEPLIAKQLSTLGNSMDFEQWFADCEATRGNMAGTAVLDLPQETDRRLGAQLFLLRRGASSSEEMLQIAFDFLGGQDNFDILASQFQSHIFRPLESELRKYLQRKIKTDDGGSSSDAGAPASDRIVRLDHNSAAYAEAIQALDRLRDAVAASNEYVDGDDRNQRIAELEASHVLLGARQVRVGAVQTVAVKCLKYLGDKFAEGIIAALVGAAIAALVAVFGIHLFA